MDDEVVQAGAGEPEYMAGPVAPEASGRRSKLTKRLAAAITALAVIAGAVAFVLTRPGPPTPQKRLAALKAFVAEAKSVHVEATEQSADDPGRDGLGSSFSSKSKMTSDVRFPVSSRTVEDGGDYVFETIVLDKTTYSRGADTPAALAKEQWVRFDQKDPAPTPEAMPSPASLRMLGSSGMGAIRAQAAGLLSQGLGVGAAMGEPVTDISKLVALLKNPTKVDSDVIRVELSLHDLATAMSDKREADLPEAEQEMLDNLNGTVTIDLTSGPKGELDAMKITVADKGEAGPDDDSTTTSDIRFTRWNEPVVVDAPADGAIDKTPAFDEEKIAAAPFAVVAPRSVPSGFKLTSASFDEGKADEESCTTVSLYYVNPDDEKRSSQEENFDAPSLSIDMTDANCTADNGNSDNSDTPGAEAPKPIVIGGHKATISHYDDSDMGKGISVTMVVNGTELSVDSSLTEPQTIAALSNLVPLDFSKQPIWNEPLAG